MKNLFSRVFNFPPAVKELLLSVFGLVGIFTVGYGIYFGYTTYLNLAPEYSRTYYVVACPASGKDCQNVEGGYLPEYCEEGECRDPQLFTLYYEDGTSINLDCSYDKTSEDFDCKDADGNPWKVKYDRYEDIKIKGWGFK